MSPADSDFSMLVQRFFLERLIQQKNASPRTIEAYRDTFRLYIRFVGGETGKPASKLGLSNFTAKSVLGFLDHLESQRRNCIRSRNARLAALRSFANYAALQNPVALQSVQQIIAIPVKRFERPLVGHLSKDEIQHVLDAPPTTSWFGQRDRVLLAVLYNTGARVSELVQVRVDDVTLQGAPAVRLHGKGRKQRTVPLWKKTAAHVKNWIRSQSLQPNQWLIPNRHGEAMTRSNVSERLALAVATAGKQCSQLNGRRISPHQIRHSTAMHLLQAGVDISLIALWLGHESPTTTHGYVEADLAMKEKALSTICPPTLKKGRYHASPSLLSFLDSL